MTLHMSKRTAILQLCNSLSSLDLVNIQQLADCKYFCDLISFVFKISPELQFVKDPCALNIESIYEKDSENTQILATEKVKDKALNDKVIPVTENKIPESKQTSENGKSETRSSKRRSCKKDSPSNLLSQISKSALEISKSTPETSKSASETSKSTPGISSSTPGISSSTPVISNSTPGIPNATPEIQNVTPAIPNSTPEVPSSAPCFHDDTTKRYWFLQKFIDDKYCIDSSKIILYSLCVKSNELELAKVAVLILSMIVKYYLSSKNDVLNTLALLDPEVQEDIKECLSLFLLQDKKVTKEEMEYILTKSAQYKRSPRSPRSTTTPLRSCSSRYKKSIVAISPTAEDVFSDSPLKSFFESPQFQNRELLTKEIAKTRKMYHAEEQRSEDLMHEVKSLKKKLENRDKENKLLKEKIKNIKTKEETEQCKSCEVSKIKHDKAIKNLKQQKEDFKVTEDELRNELNDYTSKISELQNQIKDRIKEEEESVNLRSVLEEEIKQIRHLQIENEHLQVQLNELRNEFNKNQSLLQEKITESTRNMELTIAPVAGENLGIVMEEENRRLTTKFDKLRCIIDKLLNQKCVNSQGIEIIEQEFNMSAINQSDLSMPVVMDVSEILEAEKDANFNNVVEISSKNEANLLNYCSLNDAEIVKDIPNVFNGSNLNNATEIVNKSTPTILNDANLDDVVKIENKETTNILNNGNLDDVAQIENKVIPNILNNCSLNHVADFDNKNTSLSNDCDILTNKSNVNEEQTCDNSLGKLKSTVVFEGDVPVANTGMGVLWTAYHDSERESLVRVPISDNTNDRTKQELSKQLGVSVAEFPTKLDVAKKLLALFKELFPTNGSNGFVGLSLKSDEDYIKCLLPIKDYLSRFQNNKSDKNLCNCDSMSDIKKLKKKNEEMEIKLAEAESYAASYIEQINAEKKELLSRLDAAQQKYQELIKTKEDFESKNKVLFQKYKNLKDHMSKMKSKISESDQFKNQYANLLNAKNEDERLYKRRLKLCRDRISVFDLQKKEYLAAIEKEKKLKRDMISQIESLKSEVLSLKVERKCLDRCVKELRIENMKLNSNIEAMKDKETHSVQNNMVSCSIPIRHKSRSQYDKNSEININVKVKDGDSYKTASVHDMSGTSLNYPGKFMSLNASQISASFNKSIHSFALITDDEEEYSFQGGSLAEIKKEYDSSMLNGKDRRITELHRRNTMYLPHMQSSYPVELQSMSPFSQKLLEDFEKTNEEKATEKNKVPPADTHRVTSHQALKKRKVEEVEPECEAGPSQLPTTSVNTNKEFKTSSKLQKLLLHRHRSHRPNLNPKS